MDDPEGHYSVETLNPTDVSMEAVIELAELQKGIREDAPSLKSLFDLMKTPSPSFNGMGGVSMLADVRSYALFRDSLRVADPKIKTSSYRDFQAVMEKFFKMIEQGVAKHDRTTIEVAKKFCSAVNSSFLSRQMNDIYSRRERSDARYITHETTS